MATAKNSKAPRKPSPAPKARAKSANVITPKPGTFVPITANDDPRLPGALAFVNEFLERESAAKAERDRKRRRPPRVTFSEEEARQLGYQAQELGRLFGACKRLSWIMEETDQEAAAAAATALEAMSFVGALKADAVAADLGVGGGGYYDDKEFDRYARAAGYTKGDHHGK